MSRDLKYLEILENLDRVLEKTETLETALKAVSPTNTSTTINYKQKDLPNDTPETNSVKD